MGVFTHVPFRVVPDSQLPLTILVVGHFSPFAKPLILWVPRLTPLSARGMAAEQ